MRTVAEYLAKVPPEHAGDANFMAEVAAVLQPFADAQALLASMPLAFDLDSAVGVQLDATGAWLGRSRYVTIPVLNPWFSWDTDGLGWDQGYWWGPYDGTALYALDDATYRRLLYAVRFANNADGTLASINRALAAYFGVNATTFVWAYDATDFPSGAWTSANLRMVIGVSGVLPSIVDLEILSQVLIPIQPAGVAIDWAVTTVSGSPVFGFDVENDDISGWDVGAWSADPVWVIDNIILA